MLAGRFALERKIGSGGMARVYVGRDEVLGRPVAVKVLRPSLAGTETSERFRREGSMAARLSHPNIVPVYDAGVAELDGSSVSYIVMEYVTGGDLKDKIRNEGALDAGDVCRIGAGAADALAHAHSNGVVHRDVKPHNILLDGAGSPKLTDFGIARALEGTHYTHTGNFLGTALYSAPEQLRGAEISGKTDVYSLGAALYEAATGESPFAGTVVELADKHFSKTPTRPRTDDRLADLILACLEKDPEDRPAADELAERLAGISNVTSESVITAPPLPKEAAEKTATMGTFTHTRRSYRPLAVVCVVALIVLGGAGIFLYGPDILTGTDGEQASSRNVASGEGQSGGNDVSGDDASGGSGNEDSGNTAAEDEAVGAVRDMYEMAADGDYAGSYAMLTDNLKAQIAPSQEFWSGTFTTLESVRFVGTPEVTVSGNTASVSGVTEAVHTDRTERNDATWTLVREGGEWKIDRLDVQRIS